MSESKSVRKPWKPFAIKAAVIALSFTAFFSWVDGRYVVGVDGQEVRCLPDHKYYLVNLKKTEPVRGSIMAYRSDGLEPVFYDGSMMAKMVKGMPGDHLVINADGVFINGEQVASDFPLAEQLGMDKSADLFKDEIIPEDRYLMLAPAPESYDGRYWGYITGEQLQGAVTPLI